MAWIKIVPPQEGGPELREALRGQGGLYPVEYMTPVPALKEFEKDGSIVMSHSLLPQTLFHAFSTFGTLLSPDLPLSRSQHEMIAATVSVLNDCFY